MPERILTQHPQGKQGVHIERRKYELVKAAILKSLREHGELTFSELIAAVEANLESPLDGSLSWYTVSVKLDLEARSLVERVPGRSPQVLRLAV